MDSLPEASLRELSAGLKDLSAYAGIKANGMALREAGQQAGARQCEEQSEEVRERVLKGARGK